jgi:dTDP-4-dehydrorhamnose 3,5-epimerase
MVFRPTKLKGAWVVEPEAREDGRGLFARTFCVHEFRDQGLVATFVQCNISWNKSAGTVRGLHYQRPPACEAKLVRCTAGSLWDVIVDMRPDSPTYLEHIGLELNARNRLALFVPEMFAHGFQALEDGTEVFYQMSEYYTPELAMGVRYDDPQLRIDWPLPVASISDRDKSWPFLSPNEEGARIENKGHC